MSSTHLQYGDLATQLVTESRRSTATDTLLKYNDVLVRSILREQRQLEELMQAALTAANADPDAQNPNLPTVLLYQTAILRNKRCLLAYHHHRLERLKDMYWSVGGALPLLLTMPSTSTGQAANGNGGGGPPADVRSKLSPHEVDFLRSYATSVLKLRTEAFAGGAEAEDVDLMAPITRPPKDLYILVRVVRDCGVVHTEQGAIDFRPGHRFLVRRSDVEHLIMQGFLEEV